MKAISGQKGFGWCGRTVQSFVYYVLYNDFKDTCITYVPLDCDCSKTVFILNSEFLTVFKLISSLKGEFGHRLFVIVNAINVGNNLCKKRKKIKVGKLKLPFLQYVQCTRKNDPMAALFI